MDFSEDVYFGKSISNIEEVYTNIKNKIPMYDIYCIYISENLKTEICSSEQIFNEKNKTKNYKIIGIAKGRDEAYDLFGFIVSDWIKENKFV